MPPSHTDDIEEKLPPLIDHAFVDPQPHAPDITLDRTAVEAVVKENINYDGLLKYVRVPQADGFCYSKGELDAVVARMVSAICHTKPAIAVNGCQMPIQDVRERLLRLESNHIQIALKGIWNAEREGVNIINKRAYLLTTLYNAIEGSE